MPHFAQSPIAEIGEDDVADFIDASLNDLRQDGARPARAPERDLRVRDPQAVVSRQSVQAVDKPASAVDDDAEIHFLDLRAAPYASQG